MERTFTESSYYERLQNDIHREYRRIGHALDNYGVNMSKELREALERLYGAHKEVLECIRSSTAV